MARATAHRSRRVLEDYRTTILILTLWTVLVALLAAWSIRGIHRETLERARIQGGAIWDHNLSYRKWVTEVGGVYVRRDKVDPNPYLKVPDRDKTTTDGLELTLMNPAYMTRRVFEIIQGESEQPIVNRIVSEKYLNPNNKPDVWESKGLEVFERGNRKEISEIAQINGIPYMRVLRPMITVEGCLKCHRHQGYKVGDIRGAISVSVPMSPHYASETRERKNAALGYLALWGAGGIGIALMSRRLQQAQRQTVQSERKMRTLFESAPDWEYWIAQDHQILAISPSSERITGYAPKEFEDTPDLIAHLIHSDDRHIYDAHISQEFFETNTHSVEFRIIRKDGQARHISHCCSPIYVDEEFAGRRVTNRDITDYKLLEAQLLQAQKMEAVGLLAGGIAHDFNNILTVIMGRGTVLQEQLRAHNSSNPHVAEILSAAERAANLTQQLLSYGRKRIVNLKPLSLNETIRDTETLLRRIIGEDVELRVVFTHDDLSIVADSGQIGQVMLNLAANARDAMSNGGILTISTDRVELSHEFVVAHGSSRVGAYAVMTMTDTGIGMDQATRARLFEPFFTTKTIGRGTGLGLSVVYGIITQHGGLIDVESELGRGTTFRIYLPISHVSPLSLEHRSALALLPVKGTETILLAEDEEIIRTVVREELEAAGYTVIEAVNGHDAVRLFAQHSDTVRLLLFDVIMPGTSGREAYDQIRRSHPHVKVLFMSGHTAGLLNRKGVLEDGVHLILKPFLPHDLLVKAREVLDNTSLHTTNVDA